jgi:hypothetical protein
LGARQRQSSLVLQNVEDLKSAEPDDPVYTLNPTRTRDIIEEDPESKVNKNYSDVIGYVAKEKEIKQLEVKVNSGFETLVSSLKELEKVTSEVQSQLSIIKEARNKLGVEVPTDNTSQVEHRVEEESEEDLC